MDKKVDNSSKIDRQLTFEILLYLNIFYFSFYAGIEGLFLIIKFYHVEELREYNALLSKPHCRPIFTRYDSFTQ